MNWSDINLRQFKKIQELLEVQDDYFTMNLVDIVFGVNSSELPAVSFQKYVDELAFLNEEIKVLKAIPDTITINDRVYTTNGNLTLLTTAQYIDYTNYIKRDPQYENILSIFIIPEGHTYNDGYDMSLVKKDILDISIDLVVSFAFFLQKQFEIYTKIFLIYLKKMVKKEVKDKKQRKEILDKLNKVDFSSLV